MGRVAKVLLTVIFSFIFSAILVGIAVFIADRISTRGRPEHSFSFEALLWISILIPLVPSIVSGVVISIFKLRLVTGAIVGASVYLIPIALMAIYILLSETNPEYFGVFEYAGSMMGIFGLIGAINGAVCGMIRYRQK